VLFGRAPTPAELQGLLAVSRFDGGFGGWPAGSSMEGSKNLGGVQCTKGQAAAGGGPGFSCVQYQTFEILNGKRVDGPQPFRYYGAWDDSIRDWISQMTAPRRPRTQAALRTGDLSRVAGEMHREKYFTGDPGDYAKDLWSEAQKNARELGVPLAVRPSGAGGGAGLLLLAGVAAAAFVLLDDDGGFPW
jgi:hypothetical protein